jgi:transposase-like protein
MLSLFSQAAKMTNDFKSLIELNDYFKEEKTCYEFLALQIWDEGKPVCPFCNSTKVYTTKSRSNKPSKAGIPEYRCANKECAKKFSATKGTIFESSKIPLRTWYAAIFLLTTSKKGISSVQLAEQLQVTQKTSWFLNHRIREMFKETAPDMLTGVVEADETFVGGKNKNRHQNKKKGGGTGGRPAPDDKTAVVGLVQRNGKVLTFVVPNTTSEIIHPIMQEHVQAGSTVITDYYRSYIGIGDNYNHVRVKPDPETYKTVGDQHTNTIENFWSTFKRGYIGIYHYMSPKHLNRYTNEFGYRYNNREDSGVTKFHHVVKNSGKVRLKYEKLIGRPTTQQLQQRVDKAERDFYNNPPVDKHDNINPDDAPIIE